MQIYDVPIVSLNHGPYVHYTFVCFSTNVSHTQVSHTNCLFNKLYVTNMNSMIRKRF